MRRGLCRPQSRTGRKEIGRAQRLGAQGDRTVDIVSYSNITYIKNRIGDFSAWPQGCGEHPEGRQQEGKKESGFSNLQHRERQVQDSGLEVGPRPDPSSLQRMFHYF